MQIRPISSAELFADEQFQAMRKDYERECAIPFLGEVKPDMDLYARMEKSGVLTCFAMICDAELLGIASVLVTTYPHYSKKVATVESLFAKSHGVNLLDALRRFAKGSGCSEILYTAPVGSRFERLLQITPHCQRTSSVFGESL
jgi:hypothetical protein